MNSKKAQELTSIGIKTADDYEAGAMSLQEYHDKINFKSLSGSYALIERGKIKDVTKIRLEEEGFKVICKYSGESGMYWTEVSWYPVKNTEEKLLIGLVIVVSLLILFCFYLLISRL